MVPNILPADPPFNLQMGSVGQNSTFSEHSHVAYQIKENQECSNMVANILPADPGDRVNRSNSFFSEPGHVAYQNKWNHEMQ